MEMKRTSVNLFTFTEKGKGKLEMVVLSNKKGYYGIIENVFVEQEFRRRGIAAKLINEAKCLAETLKLYKIVLTCSKDLIEFYENCGFEWQQDGQAYCMRSDFKQNINVPIRKTNEEQS
tara:strand:+ start:12200 stop:12556 length:357 start_codon:yes stop_codon:yes gene_type:complete